MPLTLSQMSHLAAACAPSVEATTLLSVAKVESGFDPLAIGVNGRRPTQFHPHTATEAETIASRLIAAGANVDLGVAQINVHNLAWLGLSVPNAFDPCANLTASAKVIVSGYDRAAAATRDPQAMLGTALSYYNTGAADRGFSNGYVVKVMAAARVVGPALSAVDDRLDQTARSPSPSPAWDVFAPTRAMDVRLVFSLNAVFGDAP